jgi:hypothetical protein
MTDEYAAYPKILKGFASHETVCHSKLEYSRGDVYTNTAESFFALVKRAVYGTYHQVSKKHLHRYCHEWAFRWTLRKMQDGEVTTKAVQMFKGKRLTYRSPYERDGIVIRTHNVGTYVFINAFCGPRVPTKRYFCLNYM